MGNCLELRKAKKQKAQSAVLHESIVTMQEMSQQYKLEKEKLDKEIVDIQKKIDLQIDTYKKHKCSRETAERVLKDLTLEQRVIISGLMKMQTNELSWRRRAEQLMETDMQVQNAGKLNKVIAGLKKVNINVDKMQDIMVKVDDQLSDMRDASQSEQDMNDAEKTRSVENTGTFEEEAKQSVSEMLDKADMQLMDLDALPRAKNRQQLHRILGPAKELRSDEVEEEAEEGVEGQQEETVFSNLD